MARKSRATKSTEAAKSQEKEQQQAAEIFNEENDAVHETMALLQEQQNARDLEDPELEARKEREARLESGSTGAIKGSIDDEIVDDVAKEGKKNPKSKDSIVDQIKDAALSKDKKADIKAKTDAGSDDEKNMLFVQLMVLAGYLISDVGKNVVENAAIKGTVINSTFVLLNYSVMNIIIGTVWTILAKGKAGITTMFNSQSLKNFLLPAIAFSMQNVLMLLQNQYLPAASKKVFSQIRIPLTAVFSTMILGSRYTMLQWFIMVGILTSVVLFQVTNGGGGNLFTGKDSEELKIGMILALFANLCAVLGSLLAEKFLKAEKGTPFYIQKVQIEFGMLGMGIICYAGLQYYVFGSLMNHIGFGMDMYNNGNPWNHKAAYYAMSDSFPLTVRSAAEYEVEGDAIKTKLNKLIALVSEVKGQEGERREFGKSFSFEQNNQWEFTFKQAAQITQQKDKKNNNEYVNAASTDAEKLNQAQIVNSIKSSPMSDAIFNGGEGQVAYVAPGMFSKARVTKGYLPLLKNGVKGTAFAVAKESATVDKKNKSVSHQNLENSLGQLVSDISDFTKKQKAFTTGYPYHQCKSSAIAANRDLEKNFVFSAAMKSDFDLASGKGIHGAVFKSQEGAKKFVSGEWTAEQDGDHMKFTKAAAAGQLGACETFVCQNLFKTVFTTEETTAVVQKEQMYAPSSTLCYSTAKSGVRNKTDNKIFPALVTPGKVGSGSVAKGLTTCDERCLMTKDEQAYYAYVGWFKSSYKGPTMLADAVADRTVRGSGAIGVTTAVKEISAAVSGQTKKAVIDAMVKHGVSQIEVAHGAEGQKTWELHAAVAEEETTADEEKEDEDATEETEEPKAAKKEKKVAVIGDLSGTTVLYIAGHKDAAMAPETGLTLATTAEDLLVTGASSMGLNVASIRTTWTRSPYVGVGENSLIFLAMLLNIAQSWMSGVISKVLSSLVKNIASAVALTAICAGDYFILKSPQDKEKIDNFNITVAVLGVVATAMMFAVAPKAPKPEKK